LKRFIDIRGQGTGYRFAWYDTIKDEFEEFEAQQAWDTWDDFAAVCPPEKFDQERYKCLCPNWVFEPYTGEDEEAEIEAFFRDSPDE